MRTLAMVGFLLAALAAAASGLPDGPPAEAQPIAGAAYKGTTSPTGTVSFTVSADGATVSDFALAIAATGPGWACAISAGVPESIPIENDAFAYQHEPTSVSGSFPSPGEAEGTFSFRGHPKPSECDSGTWTATTAATGPPPTPTPPVTATPGAAECPPDSECMPLIAAVCQFETWTGQDGTNPADLAAAVRPTENVEALWAQQPPPVWKGYSPEFPHVSDMEPVDQLDVMAICMRAPGEFVRPLL